MTTQVLGNKLTMGLKKYIKDLKHIRTGDLYKSIDVKVTYNNGLFISLNSLNYIQYLDDGKLLSNFMQLDSTIDLIAEFTASQLESDF